MNMVYGDWMLVHKILHWLTAIFKEFCRPNLQTTTKQNLVDNSNFHIDTEQEVIAASLHLLTKSDMLNVQETH